MLGIQLYSGSDVNAGLTDLSNGFKKRRVKKGKMSEELKSKRRYERHLAEGDRHGSHAIKGFGSFILCPINKMAARVTW